MKRSPLRRISRRQSERERHLRIAKTRLLGQRGPRCEAREALERAVLSGHPSAVVLGAMLACTGRATDLHHKLQRSLLGRDDDENLLLLCRPCHRFAHNSIAAATSLGLLERSNSVVVAQ